MLSRHRFLTTPASIFVFACMLLTSCGTSSLQTSSGNQPVTLTWFMWSGSNQEVQAWQYDASLVTKQYPWIHIKFETTTFADYWTKLETEAASGTLPDIVSLQSLRTTGFADNFRPLEPYINSSHFDLPAFNKTIIKGLTYHGSLRALPYDLGPYVVYYNKAMFDKYHVSYPSMNWTYAEFLQDAQKMSHGNDYGIAASPYPDLWLPFALSSGAQYLTSSGKLDLTNPQLADALQNYAKLVYQYHVSPTFTVPQATNTASIWEAGNIGMVIDGPWDLINDKSTAKFNFGIAPIPTMSHGSVSIVAGSGFGISNTSQHPDDAWKAISVLTGNSAEQYLSTQGRAFSARTAEQQYWYKNAIPGADIALNKTLTSAVPYTTTSNWNEVTSLIDQECLKVLDGQESAATALQRISIQVSSNT
jgi:ABC-type glycerol-3-phosphate transport system substrate-binding protein